MTLSMDKIDQMQREAEQIQTGELEKLQPAEDFAIHGVQLNEASRLETIYHRETGEPRVLPHLAAVMALRKRYRDPASPLFKQFIFSATPTKVYHYGQEKCVLHPDNPQREAFDKWGLPVCTAEHLASPGEVRLHMEKRHPSAFKILREEEEKQRRETDLASQKALAEAVLEAMKAMQQPAVTAPTGTSAEEAPLYVSDKPKRKNQK